MDNNKLKLLIELSSTVEEADSYITKYTAYKTIQQKEPFLRGLFSVNVLSKHIPEGQDAKDTEADDYYGALHHIINRKWRS